MIRGQQNIKFCNYINSDYNISIKCEEMRCVNHAHLLPLPVLNIKNVLIEIKTILEHQMCLTFKNRQRYKKKEQNTADTAIQRKT
jgi:hypothetical protein